MDDTKVLGIILIIVGVVLAPITCMASLIISLIGLIIIIMGEQKGSRVPPPQYQPPYPPQYPPQYPPRQPYPPQTYQTAVPECSSCGAPMRFIQNYNRWYCDYCGAYAK